jgi:hypothetical protein
MQERSKGVPKIDIKTVLFILTLIVEEITKKKKSSER